MRKIIILAIIGCLFWAGCENQQSQNQESQFEEVAREIEQVRAQQRQSGEDAVGELTGNIKVTLRMLTVDERDFSTMDYLWKYTTPKLVFQRRRDLFPRSGFRVQMALGDITAKLEAVKKIAKYSEDSEMFLVLADGATGYIDIGTEIAVPQFQYLNRSYKATEYQFKRAGRKFKVTVKKIPDRNLVNIKMTPVFSKFLNDGGDKVFNELLTAVTIEPGQSVLVGGLRESRENLSSAFLGLRNEKVQKDTVILVDVSLL
jgi:hypothetical protein